MIPRSGFEGEHTQLARTNHSSHPPLPLTPARFPRAPQLSIRMAATTKNPHACRHKFILKITRIAAFSFGLFLIAVVIIADLGYDAKWWPFIDRIPYGDKLGHIGLFGTLGFLCNLAYPSRRFGCRPFLVTTTTLVLLALISLEEISQAFIPARSCDLFDWLADLTGLAIGQLAAIALKSRSPLKVEH